MYLCMGEFVQNVLKVWGCYSAEMLLELMSSFFKMHFFLDTGRKFILSENVISDTHQNAKFICIAALYCERMLSLVCFSCCCKRLYSALYGKFVSLYCCFIVAINITIS